jgi:hypothetical protein
MPFSGDTKTKTERSRESSRPRWSNGPKPDFFLMIRVVVVVVVVVIKVMIVMMMKNLYGYEIYLSNKNSPCERSVKGNSVSGCK